MNQEIETRLREVIKKAVVPKVPVDEIGINDSIKEAGIYSVDFIKIVLGIEAEFGFEFNINDLDYNKFQTLGDIVAYVEEQLK